MTKKRLLTTSGWFCLAACFAALSFRDSNSAVSEETIAAPADSKRAYATVPRPEGLVPVSFVGPVRPEPMVAHRQEVERAKQATRGHARLRVGSDHWAFRRLASPGVPESLVAHPVDAFLCRSTDHNRPDRDSFCPDEQRLRPMADARSLVRRLWFDTIGLPPTIEDVRELANVDDADGEQAWLDLVDRALDSPQFGERWARHWLDVARYADSNGYEYDEVRWNAYPYRDWVIRAINDDLPFHQFVRWQIAGDELFEHEQSTRRIDAMTATGFLVAGPHNTFFPQEIERYDELDDVVHTVGQAFLGLSLGCARCHDHKTEPISQTEYYQLVAVFQSTQRADRYLVEDGGAAYEAATAELRTAEARLQELLEVAARDEKIDDLDSELFSDGDKELLKAAIDPSNIRQAELIRDAGTRLMVYPADLVDLEPREEHADEVLVLRAAIDQLRDDAPASPETTLAISGSGTAPCWVLEGGDVEWRGDEVSPGFLSCLTPNDVSSRRADEQWQSWDKSAVDPSAAKPRSALAYWLTDVRNGAGGLVARVAVNRVWQHYFGRGLVTTPNNFGVSGDPTEHGDLLDYLAIELIESGWSIKHVHRLILTSQAYRQTTKRESYDATSDPERDLSSAYPQWLGRLDAEVVRDAVYAVSGQLNLEMFGPCVQPPIPATAIFVAGEQEGDSWPVDADDGPENWRRSIYIQHRRSNPVPLLALFGKPEAGVSCDARSRAVVPTQTLAMWNEPWLRRQAEDLAAELEDETVDAVSAAYERVLQRAPTPFEAESAKQLVAASDLTTLVHALMLSNEFLFAD